MQSQLNLVLLMARATSKVKEGKGMKRENEASWRVAKGAECMYAVEKRNDDDDNDVSC